MRFFNIALISFTTGTVVSSEPTCFLCGGKDVKMNFPDFVFQDASCSETDKTKYQSQVGTCNRDVYEGADMISIETMCGCEGFASPNVCSFCPTDKVVSTSTAAVFTKDGVDSTCGSLSREIASMKGADKCPEMPPEILEPCCIDPPKATEAPTKAPTSSSKNVTQLPALAITALVGFYLIS